jgi:tRNA 2-thiouridine synthesizing protein A
VGVKPTTESDIGGASDRGAHGDLDLTGLKCPLPVLMTARALKRMQPHSLLRVTVTDPLAPLDLRHLCERDGHTLVGESQNEVGARRIIIRCGPRSEDSGQI